MALMLKILQQNGKMAPPNAGGDSVTVKTRDISGDSSSRGQDTENRDCPQRPGTSGHPTEDEIIEVGKIALQDFICQRVLRNGDGPAVSRAELGGGELVNQKNRQLMYQKNRQLMNQKNRKLMNQISAVLDGNVELQNMINNPAIVPSKEVFQRVAREIFSDGVFNWGRVMALFYFACRLVIKALMTSVPDFIRTTIFWTMGEQGGWEGIRSHFGTPRCTLAVYLAGVLSAASFVVIRKL